MDYNILLSIIIGISVVLVINYTVNDTIIIDKNQN